MVAETSGDQSADISGIYVSTRDLVALEGAARDLSFLPKRPVQQQLAGRLASRMRGRGMTFE